MAKKGKRAAASLGLDIGTQFIKILELSSAGSGAQKVAKFRCVDVTASSEKLSNILKAALEELHTDTKDVSISLSAPSSIVRFVNMPKMKEDDLKKSLQFEAEKYIPFNINEVAIDSYVLDGGTEEKSQMRVLLAAAKKDMVHSRVDMLKELGYTVTTIDIDSFACFNAFCNSIGKFDEAKSIALLNMGHSHTSVVISRGSQPYFTRDIQIGGRDIAKLVSKQLEMDEKEAAKLVCEPKEKAGEVFEVAKIILNNFIDELRLSFGYYENQCGRSVEEIYISGGVARLEGILPHMEENLGLKPVIWDPLAKFEVAPGVDAKALEAAKPQLAVSAGLAIRSLA